MATRTLSRPVGTEGFVGITGTAPKSGTLTITDISPRLSLYIKLGANNDIKITPTMVLPISIQFAAGEDFSAMATDDLTVTYTIALN